MAIRYFECNFSKIYPPKFGLNTPWPLEEPCLYPNEKGVWNWVNLRSGTDFPSGGTIRLVQDPSDLTRACAELILDAPGVRPLPNDQHTKLYEVSSRQSTNYVDPYPTSKEAYYNLNYWVPSNISIKNWRLLWQLCGPDGVYGTITDSPQMGLMFVAPEFGNSLVFAITGFYYADGQERRWNLVNVNNFPKDRWVPITVYVKQGSSYQAPNGTVIIWVDNVKVLEVNNVPTGTYNGDPFVIWGIGNYGGPEELQGQTMLFKDIVVANERITTPVGVTHTLAVTTTPISGVPVNVNGATYNSPTGPITIAESPPSSVITVPTTITQGGNDYTFAHWEDGSSNPTRVINVISDMALTATYELTTPPPVVHSLIISADAGGTTNPTLGRYNYDEGTIINVTAIPNFNYRFSHWELDGATRTENPITVTMNMDHSLRAVFEQLPPPPPQQVYLTIASVNGTTNPVAGTYEIDKNSPVTITATPNSGYQFKDWLVDDAQAGTTPFITVVMDIDHTVIAEFTQVTPPPQQAGLPIWVIPVALLGAGVLYLTTKKK